MKIRIFLCLFCALGLTNTSFAREAELPTRHDRAIEKINESALLIKSAYDLKAFTTDGCSVVKEEKLTLTDAYQRCCMYHDFEYWLGGTKKDRKRADRGLKQCIRDNGLSFLNATVFHIGVFLGGKPGKGKDYQWGYGWISEQKFVERHSIYRRNSDLVDFVESEFERFQSHIPVDTIERYEYVPQFFENFQ